MRRLLGSGPAGCSPGAPWVRREARARIQPMQRVLIALGTVLLLAGILWPWLLRIGFGRLPGDIRVETANGVFYFPITTCVIISIVLSLVLWFIRR